MSIALMNAMVARGHDVHVMTWDRAGDQDAFFNMDSRILWHKISVGDPNQRASFLTRLHRLMAVRSMIRKINPDVGIGFQHGPFLAARLYTWGLPFPMICAERNALDRMKYNDRIENKNFVFQTMRLARAITVQCESYRETYPKFLRARIVTIPNPVFPAKNQANPAGKPGERKILLAIGRLAYQKNFPCLIRAFARISSEFPDWELHIGGNGERQGELEELIRTLDISSRVKLLGVLAPDQVSAAYPSSHLFCLPSRWEGFPNVLAEAMAHGLPCVGFSECPGVRDLIEHDVDGVLAPGMDDDQSLSHALEKCMRDDEGRARLGQAARLKVTAFEPEKIFNTWEQLFIRVAGKNKK